MHSENSGLELPGQELEREEKGVKVAESVLAVCSDEKTNYGSSCAIILTTYRYDCSLVFPHFLWCLPSRLYPGLVNVNMYLLL